MGAIKQGIKHVARALVSASSSSCILSALTATTAGGEEQYHGSRYPGSAQLQELLSTHQILLSYSPLNYHFHHGRRAPS